MRIYSYFLVLIQFVIFQSFSQEIIISGNITDAENDQPIPYVNIGIFNKNQGTITNLKGEFSLTISDKFKADSITISHINYYPVKILPINFNDKTIFLTPKTTKLSGVIVSNRKRKTRKIGIKSYSRLLSMRVLSESNNDIVEAAQRINIPNKEVKIKAVNFAVRKWSNLDGVKIRINFYKNIDNIPQERIVFESIVSEIPMERKLDWIHINLKAYDVYVSQDFFIGIEFLPNFKNSIKVDLGAILTKGKGYSRTNSLGAWEKLSGGAAINVEIEY